MSNTRKTQPPKKPPGRLARAVNRAAAAAAPPASALAVSGVAEMVTRTPYAWATAGGIGVWYGRNGWDWAVARKNGGKAAARKRRQYQGEATRTEIARTLSPAAVCDRAAVTRPSLAGASRRQFGLTDAGVFIGTASQSGQSLAASFEDFYLIFAGPRKGKTGWMASAAIDAPGALAAFSTRVDFWQHTAAQRARKGRVLVLNPEGDGDIPSSAGWDALEDCHIPKIAHRRAGYLMHAAPSDKAGKDAWWDQRGSELVRLGLHAAAVAQGNILLARRWVNDPRSREFASVLDSEFAAPGWAQELEALRSRDGDQLNGIIAAADGALSWLSDPEMAAAACGAGESLKAEQFLTEGWTLYVIAANRPHNPVGSYAGCLAAHLFDTAKRLASLSPGARLDPPLMMVLDEPAITVRAPIDQWSAEAGGHGITLITGVQSPAQLNACWGEHGGQVIRDNATVTMMFGGYKGGPEVEAFSAACGTVDGWEHVKGPGGKTKQPRQDPLYPANRLRTLEPFHAVVLHQSTRPVQARITPVWDRPDYERAEPGWTLPGTHEALPALEPADAEPPAIQAPRLGPIALPGAAPVPALPASAGHPVSLDMDQRSPAWLQNGSKDQVSTSR